MSPDEIICTTCEDEGAVVCRRSSTEPHTEKAAAKASALSWPFWAWQVDTCPECGRGREVGRL